MKKCSIVTPLLLTLLVALLALAQPSAVFAAYTVVGAPTD